MPPDAARQEAAIQQVERRQDQEELARALYDRELAKSDAIIKSASGGAASEKTGGVVGGLQGTHGRGAMEMGPHKKTEKVKGAKTTKEAAKWTKKLAAESRRDQTGGDSKDQQGANDSPGPAQNAVSDGGVDAAPPPPPAPGGGSGQDAAPAAAVATGTGTAGASGSRGVGQALTKAPPSKFTKKVPAVGSTISAEGKKEAQAKRAAMPAFNANVQGGDAQGKKTIDKAAGDKGLTQGGVGADASAPGLRKEEGKKGKKKKPGGDIKGAPQKTPPDVLKRLFEASLNRIDTASTANTNPGPAPTIQYGGASNPARAGTETNEANTKIGEAALVNAEAIAARPGNDEIQPLQIDVPFEPADVEMPDVPEITPDPGMLEYQAQLDTHGQAVGDAADGIQGGEFDAKLAEAQGAVDAALQVRDDDFAARVREAGEAVDEKNQAALADQDREVATAKADILKGHEDTAKKRDKAVLDANSSSDRAKKSVEAKIEKRRKDDDKKIGQKYKDADRKAKAEKKKAEGKAEAKKKQAEAKKNDDSWFSRAASAVGSYIDSVANSITQVLDSLASTVAGILNAVKDAAMGIIDQAIAFASRALDELGGMLKGLVDNLIGDVFPGLASALNGLIDQAVTACADAVTAIGEGLKTAVAAAVDTLNAGVQAVIAAYKTAVTAALAIAAAVVSGDWEKALLVLLEGALGLAGIDKSQFYGLVGQGTDTLKSIVNDPGKFVGNMIDAVGQGFSQFAGNFGTHLMGGAIDWLTGSLGEAGVTLPETWDAKGVFGLVLDVMGVSTDKMKEKVGKKVGEDNMALLETAWGYVQATIDGGMQGLWDHASSQVGDLWSGLLDSALGFLMENVVTAAVTKIASMFSPVGAIVQAVLTAWNVYKFVQEQAQKIASLVQNVMSSMAEIVAGQLGAAAGLIEGSLAKLVPVAISLLANLLGLGGISAKVKEIIEGLQTQVDKGIDWALDKIIELGQGAFSAVAGKKKDEAPIPGDAPATSATALGTVQFPAETTFTDAHGHAHKIWAETANGGAELMVASTPRSVPTQVGIWEPIIARMGNPADKAKAETKLGEVKTLQAQADTLAEAIASGGGNPTQLAAKQAAMQPPMQDIFSIMAASGEFAGIDPQSTIGTPNHVSFATRYTTLASSLGMPAAAGDADRIWLDTVKKIQETQNSFDEIKKVTPGHYKVQLSQDAMADIIREFDPLIAELQPLIDEWVKNNASKKWAFWGGQPGQKVACSAPGYNALESSAIGSLFDGININSRWNIQLWGALSEHYAKALAENVEKSAGFAGFLGMESTGVETIYNQIESKAVARMLGATKAAKLDFDWYACVCLPTGKWDPDTTKALDGIPGAFFKSKDRATAIAKAEEECRKVLGLPDAPHQNLLKHLQANSDAGAGFDSNLMKKFEESSAPDDRGMKLPAIEGHLFHQRPTLEPLFVRNSTVGTSLTDDLERMDVTVSSTGFTAKRDFRTEGAPYFADLKKEVKTSLANTVRSPTIKETVLQTANPPIPTGAKSAIETWLTGRDPFPTPVDQLPAKSSVPAGATPHSVELKRKGADHEVLFAPESMPWRERKALWLAEIENLHPPCATTARDLLGQAEPLIDLLQRMASGGATKTDIATQQAALVTVLTDLYKHVPAEPALHAARVDYEQRLGIKLMTHPVVTGMAMEMALKANEYLKARSNVILGDAANSVEALADLYKSIGKKKDASEYTGRAGKDIDVIKGILTDEDCGASLAERVGHAEAVYRIMAGDYLGGATAGQFATIVSQAGLDASTITDLVLKVVEEWNDKNPLNIKTKDEMSTWGDWNSDGEQTKPALLGRFSSVTIQDQGKMRKEKVLLPTEKVSSKLLISEFEAMGGEFSPSELTLTSKRGPEYVPWMSGREVWLTDTTSALAQDYNQNSVPMGAGLSGSTLRLFDVAKNFGFGSDGGRVRALCMGFLLPLHHTFQEIMVAAAGGGGPAYAKEGEHLDYAKLDPPGALADLGPIPGTAPSV